MTISSINTMVATVIDGVRTSGGAARNALSTGTYDTRTLRNLGAEMQGYLDDIRSARAALDLVHVEQEQLSDSAADTLTLLSWERGLRHALQLASYQLRRLREACQTLEQGSQRTLYIARSGDTLQGVAARKLGSWQEWPRLLEANPTLEPGPLPRGTTIIIPEKR